MELQDLLVYWEQVKGWLIGLGTSGVMLLAFNLGIKLKSNSNIKKVLNVYKDFQDIQVDVNDKVLGVVNAVVSDYKEIKNDVRHTLETVNRTTVVTNQQVKALMEINVLLISLLPMNAEVKLEVAKKIKEISDNFVAINLLESIKKQDTLDELNDILED